MKQEIDARNDSIEVDGVQIPDGGSVTGTGLSISWQKGPLGRPGEDRAEPNGCFVETVIAAAAQRIAYYQDSKFRCDENERALQYLNLALAELDSRTARREAQDVEGTHEVAGPNGRDA